MTLSARTDGDPEARSPPRKQPDCHAGNGGQGDGHTKREANLSRDRPAERLRLIARYRIWRGDTHASTLPRQLFVVHRTAVAHGAVARWSSAYRASGPTAMNPKTIRIDAFWRAVRFGLRTVVQAT